MLNSTVRNLNNRLFRASASFDNKIKTKGLILPSCEDQVSLTKEFTDTPTGSLCIILIPASCLQTVSGTNYHRQRQVNNLFLPSLLYELFSGQTHER